MAKFEDDLDALFRLPLAEFIGARKLLSSRLKKEGLVDQAEQVKSLTKPSISAGTVNQLYWNHRDEFEELIAAAQRFRKAQKSGKTTEMRDALDARRAALAELSDLATDILVDAGNNPSLGTIRRVTTTLEALSAYESLPEAIHFGRLMEDIDAPGFGSFASFVPNSGSSKRDEVPSRSPSKLSASATNKSKIAFERANRSEESRQAKLAAAKAALQDAKKALIQARAKTQSLEKAQKKVDAVAKEAEKNRREAAEQLKRANAAAEDAARRKQSALQELETARAALETAQRNVNAAAKDLETEFRGSVR